jgi:hypothetical protein
MRYIYIFEISQVILIDSSNPNSIDKASFHPYNYIPKFNNEWQSFTAGGYISICKLLLTTYACHAASIESFTRHIFRPLVSTNLNSTRVVYRLLNFRDSGMRCTDNCIHILSHAFKSMHLISKTN